MEEKAKTHFVWHSQPILSMICIRVIRNIVSLLSDPTPNPHPPPSHFLQYGTYLVTICKHICFYFLRRLGWTFSLALLHKIVFTAGTRTRLKLSSRSALIKVSSRSARIKVSSKSDRIKVSYRSARIKARTLPRHRFASRLAPTQPARKNPLRSFMKMDSQRGARDEVGQDYLFHFHPD